uniref:G-protein coupled receptors family 1 profile domain-containing protein n=3 Tax=Ascaris TaxID=6251 RepID=A0A9J2P792_ASCLU
MITAEGIYSVSGALCTSTDMTVVMMDLEKELEDYEHLEYQVLFQGYRRYVAFAYIGVNAVGFAVNFWVLYMVAPLLCSANVKVPRSILFYIMTLCITDLMIMTGMVFLISEIVLGTWKFSTFACVAYLVFEAMNKFVAPVVVVLISRTCYMTVCLGPKKRKLAASLKLAVAQVTASMVVVMVMLWPVFAYSQVSSLYFHMNTTTKTVNVMRKCSFMPPSGIELAFGITSCTASYAIPLGGMLYWYVSVPFFLKKRAENSLVISSSNDAAMRKVIATVLVLTVVYVSCWSPYWLSIFAHKFIHGMSRTVVIASYFIHLLPYVSCSAYPVIFTIMNRGIKMAHEQFVLNNKRRVKSLSDDAAHHIRAVRSRLYSISIIEKRELNCVENDGERTANSDKTILQTKSTHPPPALPSSASVNVTAEVRPASDTAMDRADPAAANEEDALL